MSPGGLHAAPVGTSTADGLRGAALLKRARYLELPALVAFEHERQAVIKRQSGRRHDSPNTKFEAPIRAQIKAPI